jgi:H+/Cl- antiporter ClcA
MKDINGCHIHFWSSSYSNIQKSYDGYIVPPVIAAGGLLFIRVLANQYFVYRISEAGNEKYCYELHTRSGLRYTIRLQEDA